jgi:hypothetical protein
MATERLGHTATLLFNSKVLVAGGWNGSGGVLASAELYDPRTATFGTAGSMGTTRFSPATLLSNSTLFLAGGWSTGTLGVFDIELASAELFHGP